MERTVKEAYFGTRAGLPTRDDERTHDGHEARSYPTPAKFFAQVSRVIAVCLGLSLLANVVVSAIGAQ
jgi:hypothetical protein